MAELTLPQDYQDLLQEFQDGEVEFLLIGGGAVAVHGHGRSTDDMNLLVRPSEDNAKRVYTALQRFGAPLAQQGVDPGLFSKERYGYRVGRKPILIEILTTIDGIGFDEAAAESVFAKGGSTLRYGGKPRSAARARRPLCTARSPARSTWSECGWRSIASRSGRRPASWPAQASRWPSVLA